MTRDGCQGNGCQEALLLIPSTAVLSFSIGLSEDGVRPWIFLFVLNAGSLRTQRRWELRPTSDAE